VIGAKPLPAVFALHPTTERAFGDLPSTSRSVVREAARREAHRVQDHPQLTGAVTVAPLDAHQTTMGAETSIRAALPIQIAGNWLAAGPQVVVGAGAERIRPGVGLPTTLAGQALSADTGHGGQLVNPTQSLPTALTRELYLRQERRRINDLSIGRTGEADFDRVTDDPAPLLAETAARPMNRSRYTARPRSSHHLDLRDYDRLTRAGQGGAPPHGPMILSPTILGPLVAG